MRQHQEGEESCASPLPAAVQELLVQLDQEEDEAFFQSEEESEEHSDASSSSSPSLQVLLDDVPDDGIIDVEASSSPTDVSSVTMVLPTSASDASKKKKRKRGYANWRIGFRSDGTAIDQEEQRDVLVEKLFREKQLTMQNVRKLLRLAPVNDVRLALSTPLESYIHLSKHWDERRQTILQLRAEKIGMTDRFLRTKAQDLDLSKPYYYFDLFEKYNRVYWVDFSVVKYRSKNVHQVFDVVQGCLGDKDRQLTRSLGQCTVWDTYDTMADNFHLQRILSTLEWTKPIVGQQHAQQLPVMESSTVAFRQVDEKKAILVADYIDQDDLYPYRSDEYLRKDFSMGIVLDAELDVDGTPCVVMKRFLMCRYHLQDSNLADHVQTIIQTHMPQISQQINAILDNQITSL